MRNKLVSLHTVAAKGFASPDGMCDLLKSRDEAGHRRKGGSASLLCRLWHITARPAKRQQTEDTKMTMGEREQTILDQYTVECANGKGKRGEPALAPCDGNCSSTMVMPQSGNHHCVLCAHGGPLGSATSEQGFRVLVCSSSCIC